MGNVTIDMSSHMAAFKYSTWSIPTLKVLKSLARPLTVKLFNCNFHSLGVVSRLRDPQLHVSENYVDLTKMEVKNFQILLIYVTFYP